MIFRKNIIMLVCVLSVGFYESSLHARIRSSGGRGTSRMGTSWGSSKNGGYSSRQRVPASISSERSKGIKRENILKQDFSYSARTNTTARDGWGSGMTQRERVNSYEKRFSQPTTVINHRYTQRPWGSWGWGYGSVGIWDLFFLSTANHMFWYHHWNDQHLRQALYEKKLLDNQELANLESRIKELEAQGVPRDANYLPDDVTSDVAYSKEFIDVNNSSTASGYLIYIFIILGVGYFIFVRKY